MLCIVGIQVFGPSVSDIVCMESIAGVLRALYCCPAKPIKNLCFF
jgi:hypothetical protein